MVAADAGRVTDSMPADPDPKVPSRPAVHVHREVQAGGPAAYDAAEPGEKALCCTSMASISHKLALFCHAAVDHFLSGVASFGPVDVRPAADGVRCSELAGGPGETG